VTIRSVVTVELRRIVEEHGNLEPEMIVAAARPKNSPLHELFEWDNKVAGDKYRIGQARTLIRIVREEIGEDADGAPIYVRAYTAARHAGREESGYLPTRDVLLSPVSEAILLRRLRREVAALNQRYGHLKQFGAVVRGELGELTG
jgi:hypothetical protein